MKRTVLHDRHRAAGARLVEFSGFEMPVQYSGILDEHRAVRSAAGIFDVSHMGEALLVGPRALEVARRLFTNDPARLEPGRALYTVMCRADGGIVDDCIVYRYVDGSPTFLVVLNASNVAKDLAHLRDVAGGACDVIDQSDETALIAVQGPRAMAVVETVSDRALASLRSFAFAEAKLAGARTFVSRTGYTGEDGVEIFCAATDAPRLWDALLDAGRAHGIKPCGLGARDTLRLEAKLCLYGNDIDETTTPLEAGLAWVVKSDAEYVGRAAIDRQRAEGPKRRLVCLEMVERGIARHGMPILPAGAAGEAIGVVTSGAPSPTLGKNIALGYVPTDLAAAGSRVAVDVRGKRVAAEVVKSPFYRRSV
ncbi:MAG: glycine cleavage system aminomethyltransferase GcvT [Myxococcota bacterium]